MSATCRYRQGQSCDGPGSLDFSLCPDCSGPVNVDGDKGDHRKKEAKKMPDTTPRTGGTCDHCEREFPKLSTCPKYAAGRYCTSCAVMVQKCGRAGKPVPPYTGKTDPGRKNLTGPPPRPSSATKPPSTPPKKAQTKNVALKPIRRLASAVADPAGYVPATPHSLVAALQREVVVLRVVCHEIEDVRRVLAATAGLSCSVGLEG